MTFWTLIRRSLRFHARSHTGVVLGAAIGSAALIGALVVGDSVRESLTGRALARLGPIHFALNTPDRLFEKTLGDRLALAQSGGWLAAYKAGAPYLDRDSFKPFSTALSLPGFAVTGDGSARANRVNILGVDPMSWPGMSGWSERPSSTTRVGSEVLQQWRAGQIALINEVLARQLSVREGDEILVRVRKPSALGLDAAISPRDQDSVALRLRVGAILPAELLGNFSLAAQPLPANNVFLPLELLAGKVGFQGSANLLTLGTAVAPRDFSALNPVARWRSEMASWLLSHSVARPLPGAPSWSVRLKTDGFFFRVARMLEPTLPTLPVADEKVAGWLDTQLRRTWVPEDAGLSIHAVEQPQTATGGEFIRPSVEITSTRIFLETPVVSAALAPRSGVAEPHYGVLADTTNDAAFSGFVTNGVPFLTYLANLITAGERATPYSMITAAKGQLIPADMRDDEILVNEWLAEDLNVKPGDLLNLAYYAVDSGSRLSERTNAFRVRAIVPLKGIYADRTLMPDFPGVAKAESTHDWDTGFPLVYKIREKDEAYWKRYRGTPKAFVTLAAGQSMWASRFGALTAIRYDVPTNSFASTYRDAVYRNLIANLDPAQVGLRFQPIRQEALRAANESQDFGQLFLGFSLFLVVAALLLMGLLFQFGLEQRATEVGTFLALGFTSKQVRRLLLLEAITLAALGGLLGAFGGIAYAKAMLWGLATIWSGAVSGTPMSFHVTSTTLVIGLCASTVVAVLTIWLTLRKQARQPARELLAGLAPAAKTGSRRRGLWIASGCGLAAVAILAWALAARETSNAEAFFSAGTLLLITGLALAALWLAALQQGSGSTALTLAGLGIRGAARRRKRSLATIALLASGAFVIIAIGVFRLDANQEGLQKSSGTGGFALLADSTLPITQNLNSQAGREFFGLNSNDLEGVRFVPFRVHEGDEASCLNLNRAQKPRLLGVNPQLLAGRFTFTDVAGDRPGQQGWAILAHQPPATPTSERTSSIPIIPAVGDANSIEWALGKKIGDTLDYTDEQGRSFKLRLVGAVANSVLQGSLLIDEAEFVKRFPNEGGYRMFLIDVPSEKLAKVSATLARALQDFGLELTPAVQRLNMFNAVQNTYLGTFQILGGLGLLLGSAGLGIVVLRNVLERRGELGLLLAVGFRRRQLQRLVLTEHGALLAAGLCLGVAAAVIAVLPALLSPAAHLPYRSLALTLIAVFLNGLVWTWFATRVALRGDLLRALRNE